ncbi:heat- and acid-stable phosphoprotein [Hypsizygus marmoreus]|uniref:Heat- and acid-stable phosphoprotein n=1 Tax=Hypsizygus marmoreus TaxID=39966 RepID=A0A369JNS7_HYPMA|nr:heat- and acid-stable phosphoprotein [Hypsizygus marmoreus]
MVRGTGKFKQKRGGGRNFSKNMTLDANGTAVGEGTIYNRRGPRKNDDDDEASEEESEEEEDSSEEDESEDEAAPGVGGSKAPEPELSRVERRELKKKQAAQKQAALAEDDEDADLINPNRVERKLNISDLGAPRELSRREREQKEKADAKDRYWKLHVQGKTVEAKADLSRLAKIRAEREAAQAKRKAEADAKTAEVEAKRQAQLAKRG